MIKSRSMPAQVGATGFARMIFPALIVFGLAAVCIASRPVMAEPISITRTETDNNHEGWLRQAYRAYQAGDLAAARGGYTEVLSAYPDNRDAMLGLAACAVWEGDVKSAVNLYQRIIRAFPQDVLSRAALIGLQDNRQGEPVIRELLSRQPNEPFLHATLGQLQAARARWPAARRSFATARRLDPANPVYALNLAISLDRMGQTEEALNYYRATLKLAERVAFDLDTQPVVRRILLLRQP